MNSITAEVPKKDRVVTVNIDIPETLPELVAKFGEQEVCDKAVDSYVIKIQSFIRRHAEKDESSEEIQAAAEKEDWRGGRRASGIGLTAQAALLKQIVNEKDPEKMQEFLLKAAELIEAAEAKKNQK